MDKPLPRVEYLGVLLAPAVMQMFFQPTEERAEGAECKSEPVNLLALVLPSAMATSSG